MRVTAESHEPDLETADGLERGSFRTPAATPAASPSPRTLVLATYNIRYARGSHLISGGILRRTGVSRPARRGQLVARNVARAARVLSDAPTPHVVALQEADRRTARAGGLHVARELASLLAADYVHAASRAPRGEEPKSKQWYLDFEEPIDGSDRGDTGLALLSRAPLEEVRRVELPWSECAWRPRLALAASLPFAGTRLRLYNLHIDPHGSIEARLEQHRAVVALAERECGARPVVLLGDFNTLSRRACQATREFLESRGFTTPMPTGTATWRAGLLRLHADWIFVRGARISRWGVARGRGVSDHWPVWAEVVPDERT